MPKIQYLLIALVLLLSIGVYLLPKSVVRNEESGQATAAATGPNTPGNQAGMPQHEPTELPKKLQEDLQRLRTQRANAGSAQKKIALSDSLIELFRRHSRFDSVAYYQTQVAQSQGSDSLWVAAGDAWIAAMQFAVRGQTAQEAARNARKAFRKVSPNYSDSLSLQAKQSFTRIVEGAPMKAVFGVREVLEKDPDNRTALYLLGLLSIRSGQYDKAVGRFERLTDLAPENAEYWLYLGISKAQTGEQEAAQQALRKGLEQADNSQIEGRLREALESIEH